MTVAVICPYFVTILMQMLELAGYHVLTDGSKHVKEKQDRSNHLITVFHYLISKLNPWPISDF